MSDMAGYAVRAAVERCGKQPRYNGAGGSSDIEGKVARVAASELGSERVSNHATMTEDRQPRSEASGQMSENEILFLLSISC
jgi:hypothetical protein